MKSSRLFFVKVGFGIVGCDDYYKVEVPSDIHSHSGIMGYMKDLARSLSVENADGFGFHQDEEYFGELDSVGCDWNEEEEYYEQEGFLEYTIEFYDPEIHDDYLE